MVRRIRFFLWILTASVVNAQDFFVEGISYTISCGDRYLAYNNNSLELGRCPSYFYMSNARADDVLQQGTLHLFQSSAEDILVTYQGEQRFQIGSRENGYSLSFYHSESRRYTLYAHKVHNRVAIDTYALGSAHLPTDQWSDLWQCKPALQLGTLPSKWQVLPLCEEQTGRKLSPRQIERLLPPKLKVVHHTAEQVVVAPREHPLVRGFYLQSGNAALRLIGCKGFLIGTNQNRLEAKRMIQITEHSLIDMKPKSLLYLGWPETPTDYCILDVQLAMGQPGTVYGASFCPGVSLSQIIVSDVREHDGARIRLTEDEIYIDYPGDMLRNPTGCSAAIAQNVGASVMVPFGETIREATTGINQSATLMSQSVERSSHVAAKAVHHVAETAAGCGQSLERAAQSLDRGLISHGSSMERGINVAAQAVHHASEAALDHGKSLAVAAALIDHGLTSHGESLERSVITLQNTLRETLTQIQASLEYFCQELTNLEQHLGGVLSANVQSICQTVRKTEENMSCTLQNITTILTQEGHDMVARLTKESQDWRQLTKALGDLFQTISDDVCATTRGGIQDICAASLDVSKVLKKTEGQLYLHNASLLKQANSHIEQRLSQMDEIAKDRLGDVDRIAQGKLRQAQGMVQGLSSALQALKTTSHDVKVEHSFCSIM